MVLHGLKLLLWKNILLLRRKYIITAIDILLPCLAAIILVIIRHLVPSTNVTTPTEYQSFEFHDIPHNLTPAFHLPSIKFNGMELINNYDKEINWLLAYTPDNNFTKSIMTLIKADVNNIIGFIPFDSEEKLENYFSNVTNPITSITLAGIVFNSNIHEDKKLLEYTLRFPFTARTKPLGGFTNQDNWLTQYSYQVFALPGPRSKNSIYGGDPGYYKEGFLSLQASVDRALITQVNLANGNSIDNAMNLFNNVNISFQRTPFPPYLDDSFLIILQLQMPLIIITSFIFSAIDIVRNIDLEKEKRIKESLKMMGISSVTHWVAWFITYFILLTLSAILMTILFKVSFSPEGEIIAHTNFIVLFLYLTLYITTVICYAFFISVFFKSANTGAIAAGILFFASFLPYFLINTLYSSFSSTALTLMCLSPNVGVALGMRVLSAFEGQGVGLQWNNLLSGPTFDDPFAISNVIGMWIFDCCLFLFLAFYIEQVNPGEFGVPRRWNFLFTRSFWCPKKRRNSVHLMEDHPLEGEDAIPEDKKKFFQEEPTGVEAGIKIRNLSKTFGKGKEIRHAVQDLNLNMYQGNITVLLGHNGAGKTTTMSIITGFLPPTGGTAYIKDLDIRTDMDLIRKNIGLCPQHDILFDQLTVEEHLQMFAKLKDVPNDRVAGEVDKIINSVKLELKRKVQSKKLSGGMKRRLSLAMALIGGSEIVILDEPTSGLDPDARRELWTLLQQERANRTMLLTTHFMDEAEILGDRIAIMAAGQVQCCGTPLFLKNCYGADYHLSLVKAENCNVNNIFEVVRKYVPDFRKESNVSDELALLLPASSLSSFEALFTELEERKDSLGIRSYGASVTTMEEVFLKVGQYQEEEDARRKDVVIEREYSSLTPTDDAAATFSGSTPSNTEGYNNIRPTNVQDDSLTNMSMNTLPLLEYNTGFKLFFQQFAALLYKRFLILRRRKLVTLGQLLVPVGFTILGILVIRGAPVNTTAASLKLDLSKFKNLEVPFSCSSFNNLNSNEIALVNSFVKIYSQRKETIVKNISSENFYQYLLDEGSKDVARYNTELIFGSEFLLNETNSQFQWTAYFNNQPLHAIAILQNYVSNALLWASGQSNYTISTINHPLPSTVTEQINNTVTATLGFVLSIILIFGTSFLVASFALPLIRERVSKAKHLQYISGCQIGSYWLSNIVWDLINFSIPAILMVVTLAVFKEEAFINDGRFLLTLFLLYMFALGVIPFVYIVSGIFSVPSSGLTWIIRMNALTGLISVLTVNILNVIGKKDAGDIVQWFCYLLFPSYNFGQGINNIYLNHFYKSNCDNDLIKLICEMKVTFPCCRDNCGDNCFYYNDNYLGWEDYGIGKSILFLLIQFIIFMSSLMLWETSGFTYIIELITKKKSIQQPALNDEDSDVRDEREKINNADINLLKNDKSLILRNVTKMYGDFCAVNNISCSVSSGNCFGLLGINGAGKTTTFNMITGDLPLTSGDVFINGHDLSSDMRKAQSSLGYCPQFDALIEELTAREQIDYYCQLRGVKAHLIPSETIRLLNMLSLQNYADFRSGQFSGGNKRKLNTALAMVGHPALICLDEPTTGMDPGARRHLWNTLIQYRNAGNSLVLTSHSMEECEALCTQVVIMVNGRFQCLGSIQHLKAKFAEGYTVIVQISYANENEGEKLVEKLLRFMQTEVQSFDVKDRHQGLIHFHVYKSERLSWAKIFSIFENNRNELGIIHYSVTQTSLEQVFLGFARNQITPS